MKHLVSAMLHILMLLISSIIVILIAEKGLHCDFCSQAKDRKVSISAAVRLVNVGKEANEETMAEFSKELFGKKSTTVISLPENLLDFMNTHEVGGFKAKFLHNLLPILLLSGLLCLIFGVGFPFKIGRGRTLSDFSDDLVGADSSNIFTKTYQDMDGTWVTRDTYAGEDRSLLVWCLLIILYGILIVVWGLLIIPIIAIDIIIFLFTLIIKLIIGKKKIKTEKADEDIQKKDSVTSEAFKYVEPKIRTELTNQSLFDYEFLINGELIKLPVDTKMLARMKYKAIERELSEGNVISLGAYYMSRFECINVGTGVRILPSALTSDIDYDVDFYEYYGSDYLEFNQLTFSHSLNSRINYTFDFVKGIKPNASTVIDILSAFGEANYVSEDNKYFYFENPYDVTDKANPNVCESGFVCFGFDEEGILMDITISHRV